MNNKLMSEQYIRTKFITPAIEKGGWNLQNQVREEVSFTAGRVIVRGKVYARGKAFCTNFILTIPKNSHFLEAGNFGASAESLFRH